MARARTRARRRSRSGGRPPPLFLPAVLGIALLLLLPRACRQSPRTAPTLPDGEPFRAARAALNARVIEQINAAGAAAELTPPGADGVLVNNWREITALSAVTGAPLEKCFSALVHLSVESGSSDSSLFFPSADGTLPLSPRPDAAARPHVHLTCLNAEEGSSGLTWTQRRDLDVLLSPAMDAGWQALMGGEALSTPELEAVRAALPADLSPLRRAFVEAACSLVGRVDYFWGGKSSAVGWDLRWGAPALVVSPGISDYGSVLPYGLDCSGLVSWAAVTACASPEAYDRAGDGVRAQSAACRTAAWEEIRPGDLLFFPDLSHVGIAVGTTPEGAVQVVHCSHSLGGVVLTRDAAAVGFSCAGTPLLFS